MPEFPSQKMVGNDSGNRCVIDVDEGEFTIRDQSKDVDYRDAEFLQRIQLFLILNAGDDSVAPPIVEPAG